MPREGVPTSTLVCALVAAQAGEIPHVEYLRCEDPLTWTKVRAEAQAFADPSEAARWERDLRAPNFFVFTVPAETATEKAQRVPARYRRRSEIHHDWREDVPNAGVL